MKDLNNDDIRSVVRQTYGKVAGIGNVGCGCAPSPCCDPARKRSVEDNSILLGYSNEDISTVPEGANMGLGCGNPQAIASLRAGETVLDLGSGGGFDCFLAAKAVGRSGYVIGVDMTPEMISKSRKNVDKTGYSNVEFRLGEIENLPLADDAVDVIISNCVINLSPEKGKVFKEAFRVLKPGGRLAVTDIVATGELADGLKQDLALYTGCVAGASLVSDLETMLQETGFVDIRIRPKDESKGSILHRTPGRKIEDYVVSATIEAIKPMV